MTMRSKELEKKYQADIKAGKLTRIYDETPIKDYKYWRIVENGYPHNRIAEVNHMIVLKRECASLRHLKMHEWYELFAIVWWVKDQYDVFSYNLPAMSSVKNIPHAHLYKLKGTYK